MIVYLSREGDIIHLLGAFPLPESPDSTEDFHVAIHPGDPVTFGRSYDQWAAIKPGPVSIELPEVPEEEEPTPTTDTAPQAAVAAQEDWAKDGATPPVPDLGVKRPA